MLTVTSTQLSAWLSLFIFPFARILALIASAPVLGHKDVPARVKIGLAMLLTIVIAPTITIQPGIEPGSAMGLFILVEQVLAGIALGFTMRLIFAAVEMAGELAGMQMGLGFATFYDPQNAAHTPIVAQFMSLFTSLILLELDGHLQLLTALSGTFHTFPVASALPAGIAWRTLAELGGNIFSYALQMSMPLIAALLLANLALGILTRAAPQLNLFAVGFPITLAVGFATLALAFPYFAPLLERFIEHGLASAGQVVQQLGTQ